MKAILYTLVSLTLLFSGCVDSQSSRITPGAAKQQITLGQTTKAEIVEFFGTPNIITHKKNYEMWVYDKVSSKVTSSFIGGGGGGGGFGGSGGGGGGLFGGASSIVRSETTVMFIVYFDKTDIVRDYRISQTKF